jgi:hypothetical protein
MCFCYFGRLFYADKAYFVTLVIVLLDRCNPLRCSSAVVSLILRRDYFVDKALIVTIFVYLVLLTSFVVISAVSPTLCTVRYNTFEIDYSSGY